LRPWRRDDVPAIAEACRDQEIARWLDLVPQPYSESDARAYVDNCREGWRGGLGATFAVTDSRDEDVLGSIGLRLTDPIDAVAEVGYWVKSAARGRGVASRALLLVSDWALTVGGVQRLQLRADELNEPSKRVAERAGFTREGLLRSSHYNPRQGRRVDFVLYSLLPSDLGRRSQG
jgi:RimJ/RimL family protein N-acetyltransferase